MGEVLSLAVQCIFYIHTEATEGDWDINGFECIGLKLAIELAI